MPLIQLGKMACSGVRSGSRARFRTPATARSANGSRVRTAPRSPASTGDGEGQGPERGQQLLFTHPGLEGGGEVDHPGDVLGIAPGQQVAEDQLTGDRLQIDLDL